MQISHSTVINIYICIYPSSLFLNLAFHSTSFVRSIHVAGHSYRSSYSLLSGALCVWVCQRLLIRFLWLGMSRLLFCSYLCGWLIIVFPSLDGNSMMRRAYFTRSRYCDSSLNTVPDPHREGRGEWKEGEGGTEGEHTLLVYPKTGPCPQIQSLLQQASQFPNSCLL